MPTSPTGQVGEDQDGSDLDILIDPTHETTLFDIGAIRHEEYVSYIDELNFLGNSLVQDAVKSAPTLFIENAAHCAKAI